LRRIGLARGGVCFEGSDAVFRSSAREEGEEVSSMRQFRAASRPRALFDAVRGALRRFGFGNGRIHLEEKEEKVEEGPVSCSSSRRSVHHAQ
jgi:ferredoxin-NADP reductase